MNDVGMIITALSMLFITLYLSFGAGSLKTLAYRGNNEPPLPKAVIYTPDTIKKSDVPASVNSAKLKMPSFTGPYSLGLYQSTADSVKAVKDDSTVQMIAKGATDLMKNTPQYQLAVNLAKVGDLAVSSLPTEQITNNAAVQAVVNHQVVQGVVQSAPVQTVAQALSPIAGFLGGAYQGLLKEQGNVFLDQAIKVAKGSSSLTDVAKNAVRQFPQYQTAVSAVAQATRFLPADKINNIGISDIPAFQGIIENEQYKAVSQYINPQTLVDMILEDAAKQNASTATATAA